MASKKDRKKSKKKLSPQKLKKAELKKKSSIRRLKLGKTNMVFLVVVLFITSISFLPSLQNGFVYWDDDRNFLENELITTLNDQNFWENTAKIFKSHVIGGYNPLTIWTFALEKKFFGYEQPFYWHLNNLLLHLLATGFVFLIGIRLKLGTFGAFVLAALFGFHPMRVESVAWVTERKDVLFGSFYLIAMYYYIKGKQEGMSRKVLVIIWLSFVISLFSKIQAVILPVTFVFIDYYLTGRLVWKSILKKWPFFLASFAFGLLGIYFLRQQGSLDTNENYNFIQRIFIGGYSLLVYYIKSMVPYRLSPLYPYPGQFPWYFYPSVISFVATLWLLWYSYVKKWKVWFFGIGMFFTNVVLLLQILGAGQGFLADRFTYIAYFGLFFIIAYYTDQFLTKNQNLKYPVYGFAGAVILIFASMTFQQTKIWENSATLWTHVLKYYNKTTLPFGNRANYYRDQGKIPEALRDYSSVIRLKPLEPAPYNSRGRLYFNFNHRDSLSKALVDYSKAIELDPDNAEYVVNRGATYAKLGNMQGALEDFSRALQLNPSFANIYLNRSVIYNQGGNWSAALADIDKYLELKPAMPDMWYEKGRLHNILNDAESGIQALNRAIAMNGRKGIYYYERAKSNYMLRRFDQAKQDINTATQLGHQGDPSVINRILNTMN